MADDRRQTMQFARGKDNASTVNMVLGKVAQALREKGYEPVNQIVGYLISGDPTYITSHNNARYLIRCLERDEILEEVLRAYMREQAEEE